MKSQLNKKRKLIKNVKVVDLFCGVGGLTHGFIKEKFEVVAGIDVDETCAYAYEKNNKATFIHADLTTYSPGKIKALFPKGSLKILVGCAPCQAFSTYTQGSKVNNKWKLLYSFSKIIEAIKPDIISMENVPNLLNYNKGKVFQDFILVLKKHKYSIEHKVVDAKNYGVPQRRKRLILIASRVGPISILPETHSDKNLVTVRKAIGKLPRIGHGQTHRKDPMHRSRLLSPLNVKRIRATPQGGSWRSWTDKSLILDCHKKETGKSYGSVYGRMKWDDVSPTLTTQCTGYGNGRYGHPTQNRAISLREAAILQSFPRKYKFIDPKIEFNSSNIEQHIGNAVPVKLGAVIARSIKKHLANIVEKNNSNKQLLNVKKY